MTVGCCGCASAVHFHWAVFILCVCVWQGKTRFSVALEVWWPKLTNCSCYCRLQLRPRCCCTPQGTDLRDRDDVYRDWDDVFSLGSEVPASWRMLPVVRVFCKWCMGGGVPATVFLETAGVSCSSKDAWFTPSQGVRTLWFCFLLVLLLVFQGNLQEPHCAAVSSLPAPFSICPDKVCASSSGGCSPAVLQELPLSLAYLLPHGLALPPTPDFFHIIHICLVCI